ncbi:MAG: hypothetical protein R3D03_13500 [Geminicoccaceae bacterium]
MVSPSSNRWSRAVTGETLDCRLRLMFKGYELTFNVECHVVSWGTGRQAADLPDHPRWTGPGEVLRKTIRAFLSGQLITFEGIASSSDAQTERQRRQRVENLEEEEEQRDEAVAGNAMRAMRPSVLARW